MSRTALALIMTAALASSAYAEPQHSALVRPGPALPNAGSATLKYYGGPIIQNVKVVTVFWGSGVQFSGSGAQTLNAFYTSVISSAYYDWLGLDYATTMPTAQKIGRGTFGGSYNYTDPSNSTSLQDSDVQTALASMIDGGKVPKPDANTYYAVHFAPGIDISNGSQGSCSVFCAYHSTFTHNGANVMYGIIPDQGGKCAGGCGNDPSLFNNTTSVSSHELVEATTDPAIGLVTGASIGAPAGWYDPNTGDQNGGGEIGDICNAEQGTIGSYTVQKEWSNKLNSCIVTNPAVMVNDFSVAATPTTVTVPAGGMTTVALALTKTVGNSETVQFSAKTPPTDLTASFMPTSAMSDMGKTTLTISAAATAMVGSMETLTVQAAGMDATHTIDIPVMITMAPDMAMLPDLAQPNNNGGNGGNGGGGSGGNGTGGNGNGNGGSGGNGNNGGGGDSGCSMSGGSIAGTWAFAGLVLLALAFRRRRA